MASVDELVAKSIASQGSLGGVVVAGRERAAAAATVTLNSSSKPLSGCETLPLFGELKFESELKLSMLRQSLFDFWVKVGELGGESKLINCNSLDAPIASVVVVVVVVQALFQSLAVENVVKPPAFVVDVVVVDVVDKDLVTTICVIIIIDGVLESSFFLR